MESEGHYDCIIIGAGLAGLTIGGTLQHHGYKTLIIDKNHQPGGCVVNFKRGDYRFDTAVHFINGGGVGGMVHTILKTFGAENEVEFLPINNLVHWIDPANNYETRPPVPLEEYIEFLCKEFPHEAKNVRKFFTDYRNIIPTLFGVIDPSWKVKWQTMKGGGKVLIKLLGSMFKSVDDVINKYFKDPKLIELLTLFVAPFGNTRDKESFFIWYISDISYHGEGAWYPKGGAGEFTASLARYYQKVGGTLILNHEVTQILINKKRAEGVICKDKQGKEHKYTATVTVNAADLYRMVTQLVPEGTFSKKWIQKIADHDTQHSLVIVCLGLDSYVKDDGIEDDELWQLNSEWRTPENCKNFFEKLDYSQLPMEVITF